MSIFRRGSTRHGQSCHSCLVIIDPLAGRTVLELARQADEVAHHSFKMMRLIPRVARAWSPFARFGKARAVIHHVNGCFLLSALRNGDGGKIAGLKDGSVQELFEQSNEANKGDIQLYIDAALMGAA